MVYAIQGRRADPVYSYADSVDMELLRSVRGHLLDISAGQKPQLSQAGLHATLERLLSEGLGVSHYRNYLRKIVQQMTHRYAHMSILEIGKLYDPVDRL